MKQSRRVSFSAPLFIFFFFLLIVLVSLLAERYPQVYKSINTVKIFFGYGSFEGIEGPVALVRVTDGDTIVVMLNGKEEKLRLIGIDTPEKFGSEKLNEDALRTGLSKDELKLLGEAASNFTASIIKGKLLYLELDATQRDRYKRLLAYVYFRDPKGQQSFANQFFTQLNLAIVKAGWAEPLTIPPNVKYADLYVQAGKEAKQAQRGMWQAR